MLALDCIPPHTRIRFSAKVLKRWGGLAMLVTFLVQRGAQEQRCQRPKEIKAIDGFSNVADAHVVSRPTNIQTCKSDGHIEDMGILTAVSASGFLLFHLNGL